MDGDGGGARGARASTRQGHEPPPTRRRDERRERLAELEAYERSKASALDGDDGWEEVGKGHGRGVESSPPRESPPVPRAKKEKKTAAGGKKPGGGRGGRGADGVKSGRGGGRAGRGGRGGGTHEDVAAAMDGLNIEEPAGAKPPLPQPRSPPPPIDRSPPAGDAAPGLEVPTPERASDSPIDDARLDQEEPQGEEGARGGARLEDASRRRREPAAAASAASSEHPQRITRSRITRSSIRIIPIIRTAAPVDHRALLELQHRAAEMHARH